MIMKKNTMKTKKSIILLSSGLDSAVSLALLKDSHNIKLALTFDYGQRAAKKELEASKKLCDYYQIEQKILSINWLKDITKTSLLNEEENVPTPQVDELDNFDKSSKSAQNVWIPNRNGLFLNIAASFADADEFTHIIFGANKEEGTTFPDNTQEFMDRINKTFEYSTLQQPKVIAPLITFDKTEIVKKALEINFPFELIQSCYFSKEKHCGKCESCIRLKRALINNNAEDILGKIFE